VEKHLDKTKVPEVGLKSKYQEPEGTLEKIGGAQKKSKEQQKTPFYILTDDDMECIGDLIHYSTEDMWGEAATKNEDHQKKVQDQLGILQQLLETTCMVKYLKIGNNPSITHRTVKVSAHEALIQPSGEYHTIHLEATSLDFSVGEVQEQLVALGQLNIVASTLPIQRIEEL
jgi:hypothetical protein